MKSFRGIAKARLLLIVLVTISLALGACDPALDIQVHNQTDKTLKIFLDGETFVGNALPAGALKFKVHGILPRHRIIAKDMDGNVVFSTTITREEVGGKKTYQVIVPPKPE